MAKVSATTKLAVPAAMVWEVIGNFHALPDWHPAVESSEKEEKEGEVLRRLNLAGGGTIVEKLEHIDDKERLYTYSIISGPLPVANYEATLRVRDDGAGCSVEWSSEFEPSGAPEGDATAVIRQVYEAGFENLRRTFGGT